MPHSCHIESGPGHTSSHSRATRIAVDLGSRRLYGVRKCPPKQWVGRLALRVEPGPVHGFGTKKPGELGLNCSRCRTIIAVSRGPMTATASAQVNDARGRPEVSAHGRG